MLKKMKVIGASTELVTIPVDESARRDLQEGSNWEQTTCLAIAMMHNKSQKRKHDSC